MATTHTCPSPGCSVQVEQIRLACPQHWYALPKPLRDRVWSTYRARTRDPEAHTAAVAEAVLFYRGEANG